MRPPGSIGLKIILFRARSQAESTVFFCSKLLGKVLLLPSTRNLPVRGLQVATQRARGCENFLVVVLRGKLMHS